MTTENYLKFLQKKSIQISETRRDLFHAIERHDFPEAFRLDGLFQLRNASFFHLLHEMTVGERQENRMVLQRIFQQLNALDIEKSASLKANYQAFEYWKIDPFLSAEETEKLVVERMREAGLFDWYEHPVEEENETI